MNADKILDIAIQLDPDILERFGEIGAKSLIAATGISPQFVTKFAELIVKEMCGLMEQAEDDVYHCFEPSERPTEYIEWLRDWQERFKQHFGVEE